MHMFKKHSKIIQLFCSMSLFLLFAICSLIIIVIGIENYKGMLAENDKKFAAYSSSKYISNKIKAYNKEGCVKIKTIDDIDCIILAESIDNQSYNTMIYCYNGSLYENFMSDEDIFRPDNGIEVFKISEMNVEKIDDQIIKLNIVDPEDEKITSYVNYNPTITEGGKVNAQT